MNVNKKNIHLWIIVLLSIAIPIAYFLYLKCKAPDKAWDAATNFIATMFSIIVGAMISIIIYNSQQRAQSVQRLNELRRNLESELSDNNRVLSAGDPMLINGLSFTITYIQSIIIDECIRSGLFENPVDIENFIHLSRKMKFYNTQVDYFLSLLANSNQTNFSTLLTNCNKNIETSRSAILNDFKVIQNRLNLKLSESVIEK